MIQENARGSFPDIRPGQWFNTGGPTCIASSPMLCLGKVDASGWVPFRHEDSHQQLSTPASNIRFICDTQEESQMIHQMAVAGHIRVMEAADRVRDEVLSAIHAEVAASQRTKKAA